MLRFYIRTILPTYFLWFFYRIGCNFNNVKRLSEGCIRKHHSKVIKPVKRYITDIRAGCGAVIDTHHPNYEPNYPGIHEHTPSVVEYKHGYKGPNSWEMKQSDVDYLNNVCVGLNRSIKLDDILSINI